MAIFDQIVEEVSKTRVPAEISVRSIFDHFGFKRRTSSHCRYVDDFLSKKDLMVDPYYTDVWIESNIVIKPKEVAQRKSTADPIKRLSLLKEANTNPATIDENSTLTEAITMLMMYGYSILPVTRNKGHQVAGYVSWQTIGIARSKGIVSDDLKDYMDVNVTILSKSESLLDAFSIVRKERFVIVQNEDKTIGGIITLFDLSTQFMNWANPFLQLEEIENHIRKLLDGKILLEDVQREVNTTADIECIDDLCFGDYIVILQNPKYWEKVGLKSTDRALFTKMLDDIREIRNDVMHFDPDGLEDSRRKKLSGMVKYLRELTERL